MVTINIISSDYFELNGKRFAKIYQPLAQGSEAIGIYNINDTRQQILNSTHFSEFNINGIDGFTSQEDVIDALLPVIYRFDGENIPSAPQWGQITGNILNQSDLITLVNSTKPVQNTYNTLAEMLNDQSNQTNGFWQYVEDARTAAEITNGDPVYNKYFEYLGLTNAAITDYRAIDDEEANGGNNNGLSAYEVAVENGFVGTEAQWLASLQGADGADGQDGTNGSDGADGADGLSAYELAVQEGFVGTLTEWIAFLEGIDGQDGNDGADGANGVDGADGQDGLSAYEIALNNGFVGTEAEWLASLQGADGQDGADGAGATPEDDPYGASWDGNPNAASKNSIYDKIESIAAGGDNTLAAMQGGQSETTIADSEQVPFFSSILKRITWANIKAVLKVYFDGIYQSITGTATIVQDVAALRAYTVAPFNGQVFKTKGHTNEGIGQNYYIWLNTSTTPDNNGSSIKATTITTGRFLLQVKESTISVEDFGMLAANTDIAQETYYENCLDYLVSIGGGKLIIPVRSKQRFRCTVDTVNARNLSDITITGGGKIFVPDTRQGSGQARGAIVNLASGTENFTIDNIDVLVDENSIGSQPSNDAMIMAERIDNSEFKNIRIVNSIFKCPDKLDTELGVYWIRFVRTDAANAGTVTNLTIENNEVYLSGQSTYGFFTNCNAKTGSIRNNKIDLSANDTDSADAFNNIALYGDSEDFVIDGNFCYSGGHSAIAVSSARRVSVVNNFVYNVLITNEAGIEFEYKDGHGSTSFQAESCVIANNYVENCFWGIAVVTREVSGVASPNTKVPPYNCKVVNNTCINSQSVGILVASRIAGTPDYTNGKIRDVYVSGNHVEAVVGTLGTGIWFADTNGGNIANNTVIGHTVQLKLGRNAEISPEGHFYISNNKFIATADGTSWVFQIETFTGVGSITMSGNIFDASNVSQRCMQMSNASSPQLTLIATNNLFLNSVNDGITLSNNSGLRGIFSNNIARDCGVRGFEVTITDGIAQNNIQINCPTLYQLNGTGMTESGNKNITQI